MLARLYDLPDARPSLERTSAGGFLIRRAEPWDRERMRSFATDGPEIGGFAVYECTRRGFFGPTGVREDLRGHGIGAALLFRCLHSMREMGYAYAVIGGVGPVEFYEKVCGAFAIPESEVGVYGPLFELRAAEPA
ncbi:MAG: GNAT family N-acetyltransferase [bacterium]